MLSIRVNECFYLKDPSISLLGKKILTHGVEMIDEMGLERFTFKKLANILQTTESSVYRYFENKHMLLMYMSSWYWSWLETYMVFRTANLSSATDKLRIMIFILCEEEWKDKRMNNMNLYALRRVIIAESPKAFLAKSSDGISIEDAYIAVDQLCLRFEELFATIKPADSSSRLLSSMLIEGILSQQFYHTFYPRFLDKSGASETAGLSTFFFETTMAYLQKEKSRT
jgi:AcrR family transcriptional regulator